MANAVASAQRLEYFTIAWNSLEALVALVAGIVEAWRWWALASTA